MKPALALFLLCAIADAWQEPRAVAPGPPPSDAVVLFDGKSLAEWVFHDGRQATWPVKDGAMVSSSGSGDIYSRRRLGSVQIHLEFATPNMPNARDQARGNSGVYIQGLYEIQILDSYRNPTYAVGSCAAVYGQYAPLVNVARPPGEWQTYDIIFRAPACTEGKVTQPGSLTLLHNGVLVQDHVRLSRPTAGHSGRDVCAPGPLMLQDHYHPDVKETPMRFRNIWYRPLE